MKDIAIILAIGALFMSPGGKPHASLSGSIEGTIILTPEQLPVRFGGGRYGRMSQHSQAAAGAAQAPSDSVLIWLVSSEPQDVSSSGTPVVLDQQNLAFNPSLLPVRQHGTVRILNSDPVYHNVFSLSSTKRFNVGRRPKGEYLDVTFDKPGIVNVFCDIHSNMHAVIYVMSPNVLKWLKIRGGESFRLDNVPPGSYQLNIYALGYEKVSVPVVVSSEETVRIGTLTLSS